MDRQQRRFGVVVGVSDFDPNEQISRIPYATNDAVRVYQTLRELCAFQSEHLHLLTSSAPVSFKDRVEAPTRPNILNALHYVAGAAEAEDLIVLFIASHGVEISNIPYLLTSDSRMNVVKETAIDANEINNLLESSKARCIIRVFDACRTPFGIARSTAGRMTETFHETLFVSGQGWATISSCSSGEYSYEDGEFEQGVFSYYLCEGIAGKALNPTGSVTLEALVDYVKISVSNWSDEQTLKQTPNFQSDLSGIVVLSSPKPVVSETATVPPEHPLAQLQTGIRDELAITATDARRLEFTSEEEFEVFADNVTQSIQSLIADFNDPTIRVNFDPARTTLLQKAGHGAWQQFNNDIQKFGVLEERAGHPKATDVRFISSEVVIPNSTLIVGWARFSFFYWLWYMHACVVPDLQRQFKPTPRTHSGVMTFKACAARDIPKVEMAVREVLSRSGQSIVEWSQQLREFVDARMDKLRSQTPIIE